MGTGVTQTRHEGNISERSVLRSPDQWEPEYNKQDTKAISVKDLFGGTQINGNIQDTKAISEKEPELN